MRILLLLLTTLGVTIGYSQNKAKIVFRDSEDSRAKDLMDKMVLTTTNKHQSEVVSKQSDEVVFNLIFDNEDMLIQASYKFKKELPSEFFFKDVTIVIPFTQKGKTNEFLIHPLVIKELQAKSVIAIKNLWNTQIVNQSKNELLRSYQIAWALASHRTSGFQSGSTNPIAYDIQLAYRYMEIVRELTIKHDFVANKRNLDQAVSWMQQALSSNKVRVQNAVGSLANANQMIIQAKANHAYRFLNMWNLITRTAGSWRLKYVFYKQYYILFNGLDSNESRELVIGVTKVPEYEIVRSMGTCLDKTLNASTTISQEARAEVDNVVNFIDTLAILSDGQREDLKLLRRNLLLHLKKPLKKKAA